MACIYVLLVISSKRALVNHRQPADDQDDGGHGVRRPGYPALQGPGPQLQQDPAPRLQPRRQVEHLGRECPLHLQQGGPPQMLRWRLHLSLERSQVEQKLRRRVAVAVSLERSHLAVQHLIQPDGNLQGSGRAAGPHLPRPDGPLLHGLGQAVGPHFHDPANQTVQWPGQADGRLLPLPINPAKQTANLHLQLYIYIYRYLRSWSSPLATPLIALGSLASVGGEIKTFPFRHFTTQHTAATPAPSYKPGDLSTVNTPSIVS